MRERKKSLELRERVVRKRKRRRSPTRKNPNLLLLPVLVSHQSDLKVVFWRGTLIIT
jgi:hypothetical protein